MFFVEEEEHTAAWYSAGKQVANKSSMKGNLIHNLTIPVGKKEKLKNTHIQNIKLILKTI